MIRELDDLERAITIEGVLGAMRPVIYMASSSRLSNAGTVLRSAARSTRAPRRSPDRALAPDVEGRLLLRSSAKLRKKVRAYLKRHPRARIRIVRVRTFHRRRRDVPDAGAS